MNVCMYTWTVSMCLGFMFCDFSPGEVQYSRNNYKWSTLMHVDRTLPLWAFFDVYGNVQKIKMIGKNFLKGLLNGEL